MLPTAEGGVAEDIWLARGDIPIEVVKEFAEKHGMEDDQIDLTARALARYELCTFGLCLWPLVGLLLASFRSHSRRISSCSGDVWSFLAADLRSHLAQLAAGGSVHVRESAIFGHFFSTFPPFPRPFLTHFRCVPGFAGPARRG